MLKGQDVQELTNRFLVSDCRLKLSGQMKMKACRGERISKIADLESLKPYEVTRQFKRDFGYPPTLFRREARLNRAFSALTISTAAPC